MLSTGRTPQNYMWSKIRRGAEVPQNPKVVSSTTRSIFGTSIEWIERLQSTMTVDPCTRLDQAEAFKMWHHKLNARISCIATKHVRELFRKDSESPELFPEIIEWASAEIGEHEDVKREMEIYFNFEKDE